MSTSTCVCCGRPTPDGYACAPCSGRAAEQLAEIADMVPAARDVAQRQARRGAGGGASGRPGSSLPIDLAPLARLDGVQTALTTWARHIGEIRGAEITRPPAVRPVSGPTCAHPYSCDHGSCRAVREPLRPLDDIEIATLWLAGHCEWMRHRPEVDEFLTDVEACARIIRRVADPERDRQVIVGMCDCGKMLYALKGRQIVTCPDCERRWDVDASTEGLRAELDERLVTAAEAAHLGAYLDTDRSSEQIRKLVNKWGERNLIEARGELREDPDPADPEGKERVIRTYRFGDIAKRMAETLKRARQDASA